MLDSIRSAIAQEYENNLRAERSKWERQMLQLRDDHEQALAEIKSKHKLRDSAEHQIMFNEALAKLKTSNSDKDNEIMQLKSTLQLKIKGKNLDPGLKFFGDCLSERLGFRQKIFN